MVAALGNYAAVIRLKANQRAEAALVWEEAQQRTPRDPSLMHSLALLHYWTACSLEEARKGPEADPAWDGAIRNWVALTCHEQFWAAWKPERERVYGQEVPEEALSELKTTVLDNLGRTLTRYEQNAREAGRTQEADRLSMVAARLVAEHRSGEALAKVTSALRAAGREVEAAPLGGPPLGGPPVVGGVMMLRQTNGFPAATAILEQAKKTVREEEDVEALSWSLSPWVLPWSMVRDGQCAQALALLEPALQAGQGGPAPNALDDGHDLAAEAHLEQGNRLAGSGDIMPAIQSWRSALGHVRRKVGEARRGFRLSVHDNELRGLERPAHPRDRLRCHRSAGLGQVSQSREADRRDVNLPADHLESERHAGEPGAPLRGQGLQDDPRERHAVVEDQRAARIQVSLQDTAAIAVVERQGEQSAITGGDAQGLDDRAGIGVDVPERLDDAVRSPGASRRVEDQCRLIRLQLRCGRQRGRWDVRIDAPVLEEERRGCTAECAPKRRREGAGMHHPAVLDRPSCQCRGPCSGVATPDEGLTHATPGHDLTKDLGAPFAVDLDGGAAERVYG
jgi:hypothetical protein